MIRGRGRSSILADALLFADLVSRLHRKPSVADVQEALECSRRSAYRWLASYRSIGGEVAVAERGGARKETEE